MSEQITNPKDENSVYDFVCKRITSKVFRDPIKYFIDENCSSFIGIDENSFQQGQLFNEFTQFIDNLLEDVLTEGNITKEMFILAAKKGLEDQKYKKYFEQLIAFSNYNYFKNMMTKRNFAIIKMVEEEMSKKENKKEVLPTEEEKKEAMDKEMEAAIKMSLALEEEKRKIQEIEDEELRRAIAESLKENNICKKNENNNNGNDKQTYNNNSLLIKEAKKNELESHSLSIHGEQVGKKDNLNSISPNIIQKKELPIFSHPSQFQFKGNNPYEDDHESVNKINDKNNTNELKYQNIGKTSETKREKIEQTDKIKQYTDTFEEEKQKKFREYREMLLKMERDNEEKSQKETLTKDDINKLEGRKKLADILKQNRNKKKI